MVEAKLLPLHEKIPRKNTPVRLADILILFLLFALLFYRLSSFRSRGVGPVWLLAFSCEAFFTFIWFLFLNSRWTPVIFRTYPNRLYNKIECGDVPAVDMFVTTADPKLEPPVVTVNTVLSMLAAEYPANRLACYVSDDGGSPVTYYALLEASRFAELWVPFCRRYEVEVRAPFVFFSREPDVSDDLPASFAQDWKFMKNEYQEMTRRIEDHIDEKKVSRLKDEKFIDFLNSERGNHPSIVKVIRKNKEGKDGIPHLIYISREKRPKHPHHFKAGAMNALIRVSGVMTNAPFMLNVDCDMFTYNPKAILHGMCLLLGSNEAASYAFAQAPQLFYGALKDDPFGNQLEVLQKSFGGGLSGIQGPIYGGTGCIHRRKVIYGSAPHKQDSDGMSYKDLRRIFGNSNELMESANQIIKDEESPLIIGELSSRVETAKETASCTFEQNTLWGKKIGLSYGSMTEDVQTGIRIHSMGWRSSYLTPDPPAFMGSAPVGGPASLAQFKRWATGLLEILFQPDNSPLTMTLTKRLRARQCLGYLLVSVWALRSLPELTYSLLPAYCLLAGTSFLPKASEREFLLPAAIFFFYNIYTMAEHLSCGKSVREWWNYHRMQRIFSSTSFLLGFFSVVLKLLGVSDTVFEITRKDHACSGDVGEEAAAEPGRFTFDESPVFVSGTALVLVHLATAGVVSLRWAGGAGSPGLGEVVCSAWVLMSFWPFVRGLFGKGRYGIPWSVLLKAGILALFFLMLCA
ncbi:Cellulose synthase-like protein H1 [Apostasia shenzhenica]|uniref:Cellulose synthase-like protein H1 n=1 Tax=Apostasia shenzhenica TaxID=1088818 RepID=A0A2I0B135_9ASPA|nr:Cellulose synthase-like protein H1 [Apostasia shenzhenica]